MAGQTAQSGQMVVCLDQPVPLSVVPSTFVPSHSNVTDTAPLLTQMQFQGVFFFLFWFTCQLLLLCTYLH
jgi:hypothetical protein